MNTSRKTALLAALLVGAGLTATTPASANDPFPNCALTTVDNPHPSSSGIGIIAKGRYRCTPGVTSLSWTLYLSLCLNGPGQGCAIVAYNGGVISAPVSGVTYTRYVPEQPAPGMRGTGWWYAETTFYASVGSVLVPGYARSQDAYWSA